MNLFHTASCSHDLVGCFVSGVIISNNAWYLRGGSMLRIDGLPKEAYATKLRHTEREPLSLPLLVSRWRVVFWGVGADASQVENKFVYEAPCQWRNISLWLIKVNGARGQRCCLTENSAITTWNSWYARNLASQVTSVLLLNGICPKSER